MGTLRRDTYLNKNIGEKVKEFSESSSNGSSSQKSRPYALLAGHTPRKLIRKEGE